MKMFIGQPSKDKKTGKIGAPVFVSFDDSGRDGHYAFDTFGMTPADVKAKVDDLRGHHQKKAARIDGFGVNVIGKTIRVQSRVFTIVDCTMWEAAGEVELYVDVREGDQRVVGFPVVKRFATVDDVPDNDALIALARSIISDQVATEQAHQDYVSRAKALVGVP